jgi:hypothetical protein
LLILRNRLRRMGFQATLRRKILAASLAGALLVTTGTLARSHIVQADPATVTLQSVTADVLAGGGLTLESPSGGPNVSREAAEKVLAPAFPGALIKEGVLATVDNPRVPGVNGCLCWVFSVVPKGGIWSVGAKGARIPLAYDLEFVDAHSGEWIFGTRGTG